MSAAVERMQGAVTEALVRLERLFVPGVKLTFIARHPGHDERDVLITSDAVPEVLALVQRRLTDEERPPQGPRGGAGAAWETAATIADRFTDPHAYNRDERQTAAAIRDLLLAERARAALRPAPPPAVPAAVGAGEDLRAERDRWYGKAIERAQQINEMRDVLEMFARIEVPEDATDGTRIATTHYCHHQVTAYMIRKARLALGLDATARRVRPPQGPRGGAGGEEA